MRGRDIVSAPPADLPAAVFIVLLFRTAAAAYGPRVTGVIG